MDAIKGGTYGLANFSEVHLAGYHAGQCELVGDLACPESNLFLPDTWARRRRGGLVRRAHFAVHRPFQFAVAVDGGGVHDHQGADAGQARQPVAHGCCL